MDLRKNRVALPDYFQHLLWSYDLTRLDPARDKKLIVIQALNYGDMRHWRWLAAQYGKDGVRDIVSAIHATELRPRALKLAALVFGVKHFNYASRGAQR